MDTRIEINLGALAPSLAEQLPQLGDAAERLEAIRKAVNILRIHSYVTRAEATRIEKRLVGSIVAVLEAKP